MAGDDLKRINGNGGVNLLEDPQQIEENELVRAKNLMPVGLNGMLQKRKTTAFLSSAVSNADLDLPKFVPIGIHAGILTLPDTYNYSDVVATAAVGAERTIGLVWRSADTDPLLTDSNLVYWRRGPPTQLVVSTFYNGSIYWFTRDRIPSPASFANGFESMIRLRAVGIGSAAATISMDPLLGTNNGNTVKPAGGTPYRNRMVYWDLAAGYEDYLLFSDDNKLLTVGNDVLAANGRAFYLNTRGEGRLVSCSQIMLSDIGSVPASALLCLKEYAGYLVTGEPNQSTDPVPAAPKTIFSDMATTRFNVNLSCISHHTVVHTPHGVIWCGFDDVWLLQTGQLPRRVGGKLRRLLYNQPAKFRWKLHAVFLDGFYRLAMFDEGSAGSWDGPCEVIYALDLRKGPPQESTDARWFGPQEYLIPQEPNVAPPPGTYCMTIDMRSAAAPKVLLAHPAKIGANYKINFLELDANTNEDIGERSADMGIYQRTTNHPLIELHSKEFTNEDEMTDKLYTGTELAVRAVGKTMFGIEAVMNGTSDGENSKVLNSFGFDLDTDPLDLTSLAETFDTRLVYPDEATRPIGPSCQLRIGDKRGYIIDDTSNRFYFRSLNGTRPFMTAVLTNGLYATLYDLMQMLVAAMNAQATILSPGDVFSHNVTAAPPRPQFVTISINIGLFEILWAVTDPNYSQTQRVAAMLGYDTSSAIGVSSTGVNCTATAEVHWNPAQTFDIGGIVLRTNSMPRRPDGT